MQSGFDNRPSTVSYTLKIKNVRQMPLCYPATYGEVCALLRNGEDALLGEEELLHGAFTSCMSAIRGIALEAGAIEGGNPSLHLLLVRGTIGCYWPTYSHTHYPSIAVPVWCRKRRSLSAWQDGVVQAEEAVRLRATCYQRRVCESSRLYHAWVSGALAHTRGAVPRPNRPPS